MVALVLGTAMKLPVGVPVAACAESTKPQYGFGPPGRPPGAGSVHAVPDEVSARSLDDAGRDREAGCERIVVVEQVPVLAQVSRASFDSFTLLELLERRAACHSSSDVAGGGPAEQHQQ